METVRLIYSYTGDTQNDQYEGRTSEEERDNFYDTVNQYIDYDIRILDFPIKM